MTKADRRRLLQQLAFSKLRHFSWDDFTANTMAYDTMGTLSGAQSTVYPTVKSYAIGRLPGLRAHVMASADDTRTMGI